MLADSGFSCRCGDCDFVPDCEAVGHLNSPMRCTHQMTTGPKVLPDMAKRKQEPLSLPGRGEAFHHPFPDPGRLMGILSPVIEVLGAAMGYRRQKLAVCDLVAGQLVGDNYPRPASQALDQCARHDAVCPLHHQPQRPILPAPTQAKQLDDALGMALAGSTLAAAAIVAAPTASAS